MLFRHVVAGVWLAGICQCNIVSLRSKASNQTTRSYVASCRAFFSALVLILILFLPNAIQTADIKASNQKSRNERLNRSLQNFLYGVLQARKRLNFSTFFHRR